MQLKNFDFAEKETPADSCSMTLSATVQFRRVDSAKAEESNALPTTRQLQSLLPETDGQLLRPSSNPHSFDCIRHRRSVEFEMSPPSEERHWFLLRTHWVRCPLTQAVAWNGPQLLPDWVNPVTVQDFAVPPLMPMTATAGRFLPSSVKPTRVVEVPVVTMLASFFGCSQSEYHCPA